MSKVIIILIIIIMKKHKIKIIFNLTNYKKLMKIRKAKVKKDLKDLQNKTKYSKKRRFLKSNLMKIYSKTIYKK